MLDKLCLYTFFIVLVIQILKVILSKVLNHFFPPAFLPELEAQQNQQQYLSPQNTERNQKQPQVMKAMQQDNGQGSHSKKEKGVEKNEEGEKMSEKILPSELLQEVNRQIEPQKREQLAIELEAQMKKEAEHQEEEKSIQKSDQRGEFNISGINPISQVQNELTLFDQILQIFINNEELQEKVIRSSKIYKNTIDLTEHKKKTSQLNSQISKLKRELKEAQNKVEQSSRVFEDEKSRFTQKQQQTFTKINNSEIMLSTLRKEKEELRSQLQVFKSKLEFAEYNQSQVSIQRTENEEQLVAANENLKGQLEFCQSQLLQAYETEGELKEKIEHLEKTSDYSVEIERLKEKIAVMQPVIQNYNLMEKRYFQMKKKLEQTSPKTPYKSQTNSPASLSPNYGKGETNSSRMSENAQSKRTSTIHYYKFLGDCTFTNLNAKEFIYGQLHRIMRGVLKTELLFKSSPEKVEDLHPVVDGVKNLLLLIQLQNGKVLGAFTHEPFLPSYEKEPLKNNFAFIFDITNKKSFSNNVEENTISYNKDGLVWGFNEILIKFSEPQIMYTNFGRNHNVYWDGKYKIEQFIESQKQWARISKYQLYKILKI